MLGLDDYKKTLFPPLTEKGRAEAAAAQSKAEEKAEGNTEEIKVTIGDKEENV